MRHIAVTALATATALSLATPAQAILSRAWVSGGGTDTAGCGPIAMPCRSLQYTHDNVIAAGGEIDVLDSAGYGSLSITKSLTVISNGALAGVLATSGNNGITIAAGATDKVYLRGLTVEGAGVGANGISFTTGASLVIDRCVIQAFMQSGILVASPAGSNPSIIITRTTANNNGSAGVYFNPAGGVNAALDQGSFANNENGVELYPTNNANMMSFVSVSNTTATNNAHDGAEVSSNYYNAILFIDAYRATGNDKSGLQESGATLYYGRSLSSQNNHGVAIYNESEAFSYNDNKIGGNKQGDYLPFPPTSISPK